MEVRPPARTPTPAPAAAARAAHPARPKTAPATGATRRTPAPSPPGSRPPGPAACRQPARPPTPAAPSCRCPPPPQHQRPTQPVPDRRQHSLQRGSLRSPVQQLANRSVLPPGPRRASRLGRPSPQGGARPSSLTCHQGTSRSQPPSSLPQATPSIRARPSLGRWFAAPRRPHRKCGQRGGAGSSRITDLTMCGRLAVIRLARDKQWACPLRTQPKGTFE